MKTQKVIWFIVTIFFGALTLSSCNIDNYSFDHFENKNDKDHISTTGSILHYRYPEYNIGDVHPFYDNITKKWYMFYLKPGNYASSLLTSNDMIRWTPVEIRYVDGIAPARYFTLGVLKYMDKFYTWYGANSLMGASESTDLISWRASGKAFIKNNTSLYKAGARDPYVFYDTDKKIYRCVSTAYRSNDQWGVGNDMDCSIAISSTNKDNVFSWHSGQKDLIRFVDGYKGEPECSMMFKLENRWYLLASMARRTNNYVGGPTYWIGDNNKGIDEIKWQDKNENMFDGEDLCAAQVAPVNGKLLMWGWIPMRWNGGDWGGHMNLPHEVFALKDGTLGSRLEKTVAEKIRGGLLWKSDKEQYLEGSSIIEPFDRYSRFDMSIKFSMEKQSCGELCLSNRTGEQIKVCFNNANNSVSVNVGKQGDVAWLELASATLPEGVMNKPVVARLIAESDILEIFINDQWSLCTRLNRQLKDEKIVIGAQTGRAKLEKASLFRLKWLEEIN